VLTVDAFAAAKLGAWIDRGSPRDLYDLWAMSKQSLVGPSAMRAFVAQLRKGAPPAERILFGVGPITVAVPTRAMPDRSLPVISAEDSMAAEQMSELLRSYGFTVNQFRIPTDGQWTPRGDVVAICGPKSSSVTADALTADPVLSFTQSDAGRWIITNSITGTDHTSPMDDAPAQSADIAYVGRVHFDGANLILIAGVHAIGSLGAIHHLSDPDVLRKVFAEMGEGPFSCVIRSTFDGETITGTDYAVPPRAHE